ncbi:MAG TPA: tetratricopeptide repeat protein [Kofleriaceae bacterium]
MTNHERTIRKRFHQTITRHQRAATATSWFALGTLLAEASELSPKLGRELSESEGLGDPITCWRRCVKLAPRRADAWHRLGDAYFAGDDRVNAARALKRAVKLDPHVASAWNKLAILTLLEAGDADAARVRRAERYLQRAIEEDPRGKKLGWEPYAWLAEAAERRRDDPGALAWYAEANRRGDRYAAARKHVIEGHGARRRATKRGPLPRSPRSRATKRGPLPRSTASRAASSR